MIIERSIQAIPRVEDRKLHPVLSKITLSYKSDWGTRGLNDGTKQQQFTSTGRPPASLFF